MSTNFSSSLLLADLDYIAPAQACILPTIQQQQHQQQQNQKLHVDGAEGTIEIHQNKKSSAETPLDGSKFVPLEKVQITLADCLACNGCVTSAETILITNQSREEVEKIVATSSPPSSAILVSVSEQSIAAAAFEWKTTHDVAFGRIAAFCRKVLNAAHVVALDWAQTVSSLETGFEFVRKLNLASNNNNNNREQQPQPQQQSSPLQTLIVSSCPGWVCYCEKAHPSLIPHLSPIMSAQAIAGRTWKTSTTLSSSTSSSSSTTKKIHISIQPCFDKKLEAVRPELSLRKDDNDDDAKNEEEKDKKNFFTDCVLSTKELLDWISDEDSSSSSSSPSSSTSLFSTQHHRFVNMLSPSSSSLSSNHHQHQFYSACVSGAYHLVAMACLAKSRGIENFDLSQVQYTERRGNKNFRIATHPQLTTTTTTSDASNLSSSNNDGDDSSSSSPEKNKKLLQFALVYGFQHIQNVVRSFEALQQQKPTTNNSNTSSSRLAGRRLAKTAPTIITTTSSSTLQQNQNQNQQQQQPQGVDSTDFCFIEMMACPGGCTNGGGQMMNKMLDPEQQRERLQKIDEIFASHFWKKQQQIINDSDAKTILFNPELVYHRELMMMKTVDDDVIPTELTVQFQDRRKEMEQKLNNGNIISLKW